MFHGCMYSVQRPVINVVVIPLYIMASVYIDSFTMLSMKDFNRELRELMESCSFANVHTRSEL